jgi:response regulator RpfG family c-di-GMP phosphodiesterase
MKHLRLFEAVSIEDYQLNIEKLKHTLDDILFEIKDSFNIEPTFSCNERYFWVNFYFDMSITTTNLDAHDALEKLNTIKECILCIGRIKKKMISEGLEVKVSINYKAFSFEIKITN